MAANKILIVNESKQEFISLAKFLEKEGLKIESVENSKLLRSKIKEFEPDIILLPLDLSTSNGIDLCQRLKTEESIDKTFIILFSNRKEEFALIAGLESGADDFLFQPIHERLLLSRIKALLRRKKWDSKDLKEQALIIDHERYLIIKDGVEYYLPKKEFEILSLLFSKPNKVFSREEIKNAIWENFEKVRGRTVDVHIRKIREKIGEGLIATVKGVGYRLDLAS
tara:strand:+ start:392 stop:1066 length:675 start_codon:yes stop_codon:yes gene_type:complete